MIIKLRAFIVFRINDTADNLIFRLAGFFVIVVEAPCCCMFIDFVQTLSDWVDKRPYWNRGLVYVV